MTKQLTILENEVTLMGKTFNVYGTVEEPLFRAKRRCRMDRTF
jgi:hypothetical protein